MSRTQETANVFIAQDELARAYAGANTPQRDKERLADLWLVEDVIIKDVDTKKLSRVDTRSLSKRTRYYKKRKR